MIYFSNDGFANERVEIEFWARLNVAISWCDGKGSTDDPKNSLRHFAELSWWGDLCARETRVTHVAILRYKELQNDGHRRNRMPPKDLSGGRLLAYFPDQELYDGAAEAETDGFFDVHNTPPHDTWIDIVAEGSERGSDDFLVSWVPSKFVSLVDRGISINPEECILWLDNHEHPLVDTLRKRNLLN